MPTETKKEREAREAAKRRRARSRASDVRVTEMPPRDPMLALSGAERLYRTDDPNPQWRHKAWRAGPEAQELQQRMRFLEGGALPDLPERPVTPENDLRELRETFVDPVSDAAGAVGGAVRRGFEPTASARPSRATEADMRRATMAAFMAQYPEMAATMDPWMQASQETMTGPMQSLRFADTVSRDPADVHEMRNLRAAHAARMQGPAYQGPQPRRREGFRDAPDADYYGGQPSLDPETVRMLMAYLRDRGQ